MRAIQGLIILMLSATAAFAGSYQLSDWCFYSGSLDTGNSCNPNAFAAPFVGTSFDTSYDPNTLGTVWTGSLSAGTYNILAYYDFDLAIDTTGSFNEFATITGTPGATQGFFVGDPNGGSVFGAFAAADLSNTNNVATALGLPDPCCDVAVTMGFKDFQIPVGYTGVFQFHVTDVLPNVSWYITQADPTSGDTIYYYQTATLTQLATPPSEVPEPATFVALGAGLAGLLAVRRKRGAFLGA